MGNLQQQCRGIWPQNRFVLDNPDAIFRPHEKISGRIQYPKERPTSIIVCGTICFCKKQRKRREKCLIEFFHREYPLNRTIDDDNDEEKFEIDLDEDLPPSFNERTHCPYLSYSLNFVSKTKLSSTNEKILWSIPIRICPEMTIDRPLLMTPLFFGPVENHHSGMKLEIKVNRAAFNFDDLIEIFYELQNPREVFIHRIEISLGIYYLINSQVSQEDLCRGMEIYHHRTSEMKLIRNKALLNIPKKFYLPPTYKFQYAREGDRTSFFLTIDYKIQFRIFLRDDENLWQVDVPIVLAHKTIDPVAIETEKISVNVEQKMNSNE